jgi:hypothetical protein
MSLIIKKNTTFKIPRTGIQTFLPSSLGGLSLWLKADAGVTLAGSDVIAWADQSSNGNNFSISSGTVTKDNNIISSNPAILFNGGRLAGNDIVTAKTIYAVIKTLNYSASQYSAIFEATGGGLYSAISGTEWGSYFNGEYSSFDSIATNTSTIIATISNDGESYEFRRDGERIHDDTNGSGFYSRFAAYLGNDGSGGQSADVYLSEIIVYNRAITNTECQQVEEYLNAKYLIY